LSRHKIGDIDPYVLREFRDAVDYIRKTAWAFRNGQERQVQRRIRNGNSLLVTERIRRGRSSMRRSPRPEEPCHSSEAAEIEDLLHAVEHLTKN